MEIRSTSLLSFSSKRVLFAIFLAFSVIFFLIEGSEGLFRKAFEVSDSKSYAEAGSYYLGQAEFHALSYQISVRPYLISVFGYLFSEVLPTSFVLIVNLFFLFLIGHNLWAFFREVGLAEKLSYFLVGTFYSTVGCLALTPHFLSEIPYVYLLTLGILFLFRKQWVKLLLIFALASVVRPATANLTLLIFPWVLYRLRPLSTKKVLGPILALMPLLIQFGIMKSHYGINGATFIDANTVHDYFLSRIEHEKSGEELQKILRRRHRELRSMIAEPRGFQKLREKTSQELKGYLLQEPLLVFKVLTAEVLRNVRQPSSFVKSGFLAALSAWQGQMYFVFFILSIVFVGFNFRKLNNGNLIFLMALTGYHFLTSGVSFWQGDRLTLPADPLVLMGVGLCLSMRAKNQAEKSPQANS